MNMTRLLPSLLAFALLCLTAAPVAAGGAGGVGGAGGLGDGGMGGGQGGAQAGGGDVGGGLVLADADGDGFMVDEGDCDDDDPDVHPNATEVCNGRDDNCDGEIDEGLVTEGYYDGDGDGWGDLNQPAFGCPNDLGDYVEESHDCDDQDGNTYPGAQELCDGRDNDCNGLIDDGDPCSDYENAGPTPSANLVAALLLSAWMGVSAWRRRRKHSR